MSGALKLLIGLVAMVVVAAVISVVVNLDRKQPLGECLVGYWSRDWAEGTATFEQTLTFNADGTYSHYILYADYSNITESGEYEIVGDRVRQRPTRIESTSNLPQPSGKWTSGTHQMTCDGDTLTDTFIVEFPDGTTQRGYGPITYFRLS